MAVDKSGRVFLVGSVPLLHPEVQTVEEMLDGWRTPAPLCARHRCARQDVDTPVSLETRQSARHALVSVTNMADLWREARVRPMTVDEAADVAAWRYGGDWSVYDLSTSQLLLDNLSSYYAVVNGDKLIGFCCIGIEARTAGMNGDPAILDVGMGMNPKLVGRGNGARFGETVLQYLDVHHPGLTLRAVVQSWNERSLRLTRRLGFQDAGELIAVQGGRPVTYRVVQRPPHRDRI